MCYTIDKSEHTLTHIHTDIHRCAHMPKLANSAGYLSKYSVQNIFWYGGPIKLFLFLAKTSFGHLMKFEMSLKISHSG